MCELQFLGSRLLIPSQPASDVQVHDQLLDSDDDIEVIEDPTGFLHEVVVTDNPLFTAKSKDDFSWPMEDFLPPLQSSLCLIRCFVMILLSS